MNGEEFAAFVEGYFDAVRFCGVMVIQDDELQSVGLDETASLEFGRGTLQKIVEECYEFCHEQGEPDTDVLLEEYTENVNAEYAETFLDAYALAGEDFYLTRCGHGAGFWDRGLGKLGVELSERSKPYGDQSFTILPDGNIGIL